MIIIDMNQISLANVMMNFHMNKSDELEEDMVRSYVSFMKQHDSFEAP